MTAESREAPSRVVLVVLCVLSMRVRPTKFGFDHINRNAPVLIRTPKLTRFEPAQYWGGGPPGNSVVLNPLFCCCFFVELGMGGEWVVNGW
jgi:hypothetical protein